MGSSSQVRRDPHSEVGHESQLKIPTKNLGQTISLLRLSWFKDRINTWWMKKSSIAHITKITVTLPDWAGANNNILIPQLFKPCVTVSPDGVS